MKQVMVWLVGSLLWISAAQGKGYAGEFDYYAMALSWSPEHCAIKPGDREQCARKLGFVLHGLWPQYQRGYPTSCTREWLDADMEQQFAGLYPSRFLYRHEWEKHGTCSGLSQEAFHQLASDLRQKVKIPAAYQSPEEPLRKNSFQLKADLASANEWLAPDNITVACADGAASCGRSTSASTSRERMPFPAPTRCRSGSAAPVASRTSCCAACVDTSRSALRGPMCHEPQGA